MGYLLGASSAIRICRRSLAGTARIPAFLKTDKHAGIPHRGEQASNIRWKKNQFASRAELETIVAQKKRKTVKNPYKLRYIPILWTEFFS